MATESVRAIIEKDGMFFLVKNTLAGDFLHLIGGGIKYEETLHEALAREIKEETGKKSTIGNLVAIHRIKFKNTYLPTSYFFHIKNSKDFVDIDISKTTHGQKELENYGFFDINDVKLLPDELKSILPELLDEEFSGPCRIIESDFVKD